MDQEFDLALADIRLLQTWHLLRRTLDKHPDNAALSSALEAIHTARDIVRNLRAA